MQVRLFSSGTYAAEAVDAVANHRIQQNWAVLDSEEEIERERRVKMLMPSIKRTHTILRRIFAGSLKRDPDWIIR